MAVMVASCSCILYIFLQDAWGVLGCRQAARAANISSDGGSTLGIIWLQFLLKPSQRHHLRKIIRAHDKKSGGIRWGSVVSWYFPTARESGASRGPMG